jgi:hypothetical protein
MHYTLLNGKGKALHFLPKSGSIPAIMKNTIAQCAISPRLVAITLSAIVAFATIGCPTDGGDDGFLGEELNLEGQVYLLKMNTYSVSYQDFTDTVEINREESGGGSGKITNGKLSYTIGTPAAKYLQTLSSGSVDGMGGDLWDNIAISKTNVKGYVLSLIAGDDPQEYYELSRASLTTDINISAGTGSIITESVSYVYVNNDVTLSGKGKKGVLEMVPYKTEDLDLSLKTGWNALYTKIESTISVQGNTMTITQSLDNPDDLKWLIAGEGGGGIGFQFSAFKNPLPLIKK